MQQSFHQKLEKNDPTRLPITLPIVVPIPGAINVPIPEPTIDPIVEHRDCLALVLTDYATLFPLKQSATVPTTNDTAPAMALPFAAALKQFIEFDTVFVAFVTIFPAPFVFAA